MSTSRIDGPLKTTGQATYAYEWHDVVPTPAYGYVVGSAIANGRITSIDISQRESRIGRTRDRDGRQRRQAWQGRTTTRRSCSAAPRSITTTRRSPWSSPRPSSRRARRSACDRSTSDEAKGSFDLRGEGRRRHGARQRRRQARRHSRWGFRGRVRRCARATRCHLHHARSGSRDDGAARLDRGWNGDKLTLWTSNQMIAWTKGDVAKTLGHSRGERPLAFAIHRRWIRRKAVPPRRRAVWLRLAPAPRGPTGQGRVAAAAHVQQHDTSTGYYPAYPHRRGSRRQDHGDRP